MWLERVHGHVHKAMHGDAHGHFVLFVLEKNVRGHRCNGVFGVCCGISGDYT